MNDDEIGDRSPEVEATRVENPDDYNRVRRLEQIHDARDAVHKFVRKNDLSHEPGTSFDPAKGEMLARLVSMYIFELIPLLEEADLYDDQDPDRLDAHNLRQFAGHTGLDPESIDSKVSSPTFSLRIFSAANQYFRRTGLDLKLVDEAGEARFDYSDNLENGPPEHRSESNQATEAGVQQPGDGA